MPSDKRLAMNWTGIWKIFSRITCLIAVVYFGNWFFPYTDGFVEWLNGFEKISLPTTGRELEILEYVPTIIVSFILYRILLYNVKNNIVKIVYKPRVKAKRESRPIENVEKKEQVLTRF